MSDTLGALATEPKAMAGPPMARLWSGFRAWRRNVDGAVAIRSSTMSGSKRTRGPSPSTVGARLGQQAAGLGVQEVHADVAQDPQRREVDGLELVLRHDLGGSHPQRRLGPRALLGDQAAPPALAASPAPPAATSGVAPALATQLRPCPRLGRAVLGRRQLGPGLGGGFGHGGPSSPLVRPRLGPVGPPRRQLPEQSSRE